MAFEMLFKFTKLGNFKLLLIRLVEASFLLFFLAYYTTGSLLNHLLYMNSQFFTNT